MNDFELPSPKILIAIMSLGVVLGAAVVDFGRTAPGTIIAAHGRIDGLAESCSDCHGGWTTTMAESCLECHEMIGVHIEERMGVHGTIDQEGVMSCNVCHSEHHGETFLAVSDVSFARAGIPDRLEFDHEIVGWLMEGKHLELDCAECHEFCELDVVPAGEHRYLGLNPTCATCHEDVHEGAFRNDCIICHVQSSFDEHHFVDHDDYLDLVGGHAGISCRECHAKDSSHSLEILRGPENRRPDSRSCAACHDVPHEESFVVEAALTAGVADPASLIGPEAHVLCSDCHEPHHLSFQDDAESMSPEQHAASGFVLDRPHHEVSCDECHVPDLPYADRYPGRDQDTCASCHEDVHEGQFDGLEFLAVADFVGGLVDEQGCLTCHARTHFEPTNFGVEAHADTDLPLEGTHAEIECAECHAADASGLQAFSGIDHTCDSCHEDAHLGFFDELLEANPPVPFHGDCARCHDATGFSPIPAETFDHEFWTGYPLIGAHAVTECTTCHQPSDTPDATGRTLGRVSEVYGEVQGCVTCHDDVHEGLFDRDGVEFTVGGREDCARCHAPTSFRDLPFGFEHGTWTGWELEDAHAEADCADCHEPMRRPDELGRTWGRALGRECSACHQDDSPHGDQFDVAPEPRECSKCHQSSREFKQLVFSHTLDSKFPLEGAHQEVECAGCHKPDEVTGVTVYIPLGTECVDCHGVHESALRRRNKR
ncbi:MAG: cytochrome c3 family protein [Planctomycetota bacterium]